MKRFTEGREENEGSDKEPVDFLTANEYEWTRMENPSRVLQIRLPCIRIRFPWLQKSSLG